jgi:hypothetical protein
MRLSRLVSLDGEGIRCCGFVVVASAAHREGQGEVSGNIGIVMPRDVGQAACWTVCQVNVLIVLDS